METFAETKNVWRHVKDSDDLWVDPTLEHAINVCKLWIKVGTLLCNLLQVTRTVVRVNFFAGY